MRRTLTDAVMLRAAKRRLAEHLATRPATKAEADAIRDHFEAEAASLRAAAGQLADPKIEVGALRRREWTDATMRESRPVWPAVYREIRACREDRGRLEHAARLAESQAAAWECDGPDMSAAWEATRAELQARVDYYARLVAATEVA